MTEKGPPKEQLVVQSLFMGVWVSQQEPLQEAEQGKKEVKGLREKLPN